MSWNLVIPGAIGLNTQKAHSWQVNPEESMIYILGEMALNQETLSEDGSFLSDVIFIS